MHVIGCMNATDHRGRPYYVHWSAAKKPPSFVGPPGPPGSYTSNPDQALKFTTFGDAASWLEGRCDSTDVGDDLGPVEIGPGPRWEPAGPPAPEVNGHAAAAGAGGT